MMEINKDSFYNNGGGFNGGFDHYLKHCRLILVSNTLFHPHSEATPKIPHLSNAFARFRLQACYLELCHIILHTIEIVHQLVLSFHNQCITWLRWLSFLLLMNILYGHFQAVLSPFPIEVY